LTAGIILKNIEEKGENRYNIHGLSCIGSFPEANRWGSISARQGSPYMLTWRDL
jgi:hypothetical protein